MRGYSRLSRGLDRVTMARDVVREPLVALLEGISRSKLVFAGGHERLEALPVKDLERVREPVSRSNLPSQDRPRRYC
jgi:hypothetical protein